MDISAQHYEAYQDNVHIKSTSELSFLMHDVITLSDVTSYDTCKSEIFKK